MKLSQFKHDEITWTSRLQNEFIDQLIFEYRPWRWFAVFEYLSQNGCVARILYVRVDRICSMNKGPLNYTFGKFDFDKSKDSDYFYSLKTISNL